jgi:NADPH:quinone reductase-like Zn-dependent oxidoreductase
MSHQSFPAPVAKFFETAKNIDIDGFVSCFSPTCIMLDEGHTFRGHDVMKNWAEITFKQFNTTIETTGSQQLPGEFLVSAIFHGDFLNVYGVTSFPIDLYFTHDNETISFLNATDLLYGRDTMNAIYAIRQDNDDPLSILAVDKRMIPHVPEEWIKIKVLAASINHHDISTLRGNGVRKITYPMTLGCEAAGILPDNSQIMIYPIINDPQYTGDETLDPNRRMLSEIHHGTFAEYVVIPRRNIIPCPKEISAIAASTLGISWLTAYRMLFTRSGLKRGETMLVQASSGGITTALIQLGVATGMTVWIIGRNEERQFASSLGGHKTFSPGESLPARVDALFDTCGDKSWQHLVEFVKMGGTIVTCGDGGNDTKSNSRNVVGDNISVHESYLGSREEFEKLISFIVDKGIEPKVAQVLPWDKAKEGFCGLMDGTKVGKVTLTF